MRWTRGWEVELANLLIIEFEADQTFDFCTDTKHDTNVDLTWRGLHGFRQKQQAEDSPSSSCIICALTAWHQIFERSSRHLTLENILENRIERTSPPDTEG